MENRYARRISSMFSLTSTSSEQNSNTASSHARQKSMKISRTPSLSKQLNVPRLDLPQPEPGSIQLRDQTEESAVQASQQEADGTSASSNGIVTSPDEIPQPSPPILNSVPAEPYFSLSNVSESKRESKPEKVSERRPERSSKSTSRDGSSCNSPVESKGGARPPSPSNFLHTLNPSELRKSTRRSWIPGKTRTDTPIGGSDNAPRAWLMESGDKKPYDISKLATFQKVAELWDGEGNTLIYLHSGAPGKGPSFKIRSASFASSRKLSSVVHGRSRSTASNNPYFQRVRSSADWNTSRSGTNQSESRTSSPSMGFSDDARTQTFLSPPSSPSISPKPEASAEHVSQGRRAVSDSYSSIMANEIHLHIPLPLQTNVASSESALTPEDVEMLIATRNAFAFLVGQPLVATPQTSTTFEVFLKIADFLQRYEFSSFDGSTLGEVSENNFKRHIEDFRLADVRNSREKTIEAIVLGERMRSRKLYNEGFVHGVGKYDDIVQLRSPKFHLITEGTLQRMERATIDLGIRLKTVRTRLEDFEFPSLFSGIAQSTNSTESKIVRFKEWQTAFTSIRKHVISFYVHRYGAWPPRARSKKNSFEESGLNRILLRELYQDFCDLYDTLVDRTSFTTRIGEAEMLERSEDVDSQVSAEVLRKVLSEYDQSSPPVQPPVPFDTPRLPSLATIRRDYTASHARKQKKEQSKRLLDDEINQALMQSYNRDGIKPTPFLEAFMSYERKAAHGKSIDEIVDLRNGQWIFMYVVLQSLPLVVIDAPDLMCTKGVEYFLCEVPKGTPPWCQEDHSRKMGWYGIAGGTGVVSLPDELVEHGVEGIYARSYLWTVARQWTGHGPIYDLIDMEEQVDGLMVPPSPSSPHRLDSRSPSPSVNIGLEALPLSTGAVPSGAKRASFHDPSKSFENILGLLNTESEPKKSGDK